MKRAEVQLPDGLYQQVEGLAAQLHVTVPDLLSQAVEQMVRREIKPNQKVNNGWRFPEGRRLGTFRVSVADWRIMANEAAT